MSPKKSEFKITTAIKVAALYTLISIFWIVLSDVFVTQFTQDPALIRILSIAKGWLYVFLIALLIYWLIQRDEAKRLEAEKKLRISEEQYRLMVENIPDYANIYLDTTGTIVSWNLGAERLFGYKSEKIVGQHYSRLYSPEDVEKLYPQNDIKEAFDKGSFQVERYLACCLEDHQVFLASINLAILRDEDGIHRGYGCTVRNISEYRKVETELRSTLRELDIVFNAVPAAIWIKDKHNNYIRINKTAARLLEMEPDAVAGKSAYELFPSTGEEIYQQDLKVIQSGEILKDVLTPIQTSKGVTKLLLSDKIPYYGSDGELVGVIVFSLDVTEQSKIQKEVKNANAYNRGLIESTVDPLFIVSPLKRLIDLNRAAEQATEYSRGELLGKEFDSLFTDSTKAKELFERALTTGETKGVILNLLNRRGESSPYLISAAVYRNEENEIIGVIAAAKDISDLKKAEERLYQAQKMESIGKLAGGVAHDFNNLLTGIMGYANLLKMELPPGTPFQEAAMTIEKAAERASELTRQLLGFARQGKIMNVPVKINDVVREVTQLLARTLNKNIIIRQETGEEDYWVLGDPGQLQQVVLNLAVNARDAMPDGGVLAFGIKKTNIDEKFCLTHPGIKPGEYVLLSVKDTGKGIPLSVQNRIFEPYFTTKKEGEGTGMGLAMAYGIVKNHSGGIYLTSEPGKGAQFDIYLPFHGESPPEAAVAVPAEKLPKGEGLILLVDDESIIRELATTLLAQLGYQVKTASNGQQAIDYYQQHYHEVHLVILDMIMPGMSGPEVFNLMKEINPQVKVIISSGYGRDGKVQGMINAGVSGFIPKPFTLQELAAEVERVIRS